MDLGLNDRRAIVTGGSKGLGFAIARELLSEGAVVRICARNAGEVEAAVGRLGEGADGRVVDVRDAGQLNDFVAWAAESMGGIDVLVCGRIRAGLRPGAPGRQRIGGRENLGAGGACCRAGPRARRLDGNRLLGGVVVPFGRLQSGAVLALLVLPVGPAGRALPHPVACVM